MRVKMFAAVLAFGVLSGCVVEESVNGEAKPKSGFSMSPGIKISRQRKESSVETTTQGGNTTVVTEDQE